MGKKGRGETPKAKLPKNWVSQLDWEETGQAGWIKKQKKINELKPMKINKQQRKEGEGRNRRRANTVGKSPARKGQGENIVT